MSWAEITLAFVSLALFGALLWLHARMNIWITGRTRIYRIALAYVASGKSHPDTEQFAMAMLDGNHAALARRFHGWPEFYAREIERMEEDDNG